MKHRIIFTIALALISQLVSAGSIPDTYSTGTPLTATIMNNIKTAVNDNDARTSINSNDITSIGTELMNHALSASAHHSKYTNSEAVAAIKAADGTGSLLDADMLDGNNSSDFASSNQSCTDQVVGGIDINGNIICTGLPTVVKNIDISTSAMNIPPTSGIIIRHNLGLLWTAFATDKAYISIKKPTDYNGSNITFKLLVQTTTNTGGLIVFFMHPRSYTAGVDIFGSEADIQIFSTSIDTITNGLYQLSDIIPSTKLAGEWWVIELGRQRNLNNLDDVIVMGATIEYTAIQ